MKYMFWNKKTTKEEILTKEEMLTEEEMLLMDQWTLNDFDKEFSIIGRCVMYKAEDFTCNIILDDAVYNKIEINTRTKWTGDKQYKYCFRFDGLCNIAFYTKEKADEYLMKVIRLLESNKNK